MSTKGHHGRVEIPAHEYLANEAAHVEHLTGILAQGGDVTPVLLAALRSYAEVLGVLAQLQKRNDELR